MRNTVLEVGYVGTKGVHLLGDVNINQPTLAARLANPTADANSLVPYLGYQTIKSRDPIFDSNYNSLQVSKSALHSGTNVRSGLYLVQIADE